MIKALIPVRSGSERVKNKNFRPFAGSSLLEIKIRQLQRIPELDGVVVNSNDEEMLACAKRCGAETVLRDPYYASSTVPINEVYRDIARHFDADVMVYANCTNPLIRDESVSRCIAEFKGMDESHDTLNSAHFIREFLWQNGHAINYDPSHMPKSQNLPDILALNFAVNIAKTEDIVKNGSIVGLRPFLVPIDQEEATDIDNEIDFVFAEYVYKLRLNG